MGNLKFEISEFLEYFFKGIIILLPPLSIVIFILIIWFCIGDIIVGPMFLGSRCISIPTIIVAIIFIIYSIGKTLSE